MSLVNQKIVFEVTGKLNDQKSNRYIKDKKKEVYFEKSR